MRTTPPQVISNLCKNLGDAGLQALEGVIGSLNSSARSQARRNKRHGGFSLRSSFTHAVAAYVSSVAFAASCDRWDAEDVNELIDTPLINERTGRYLQDAIPTAPGRTPTAPTLPVDLTLPCTGQMVIWNGWGGQQLGFRRALQGEGLCFHPYLHKLPPHSFHSPFIDARNSTSTGYASLFWAMSFPMWHVS